MYLNKVSIMCLALMCVAFVPVPADTTTDVIEFGWASQYASGVMAGVIRTRQAELTSYDLPLDVSEYDGYVAHTNCTMIGKTVYLIPLGSYRDWEKFLVTDCSGHVSTTRWMQRNNIICEVDYATVLRWSEELNRNLIRRGIRVFYKEESGE